MKPKSPTPIHAAPLTRRRLVVGGASTVALALLGCGGGDGGAHAGVGSGGTGSFSSGVIRGFGSIIVNDVRYDDRTATVLGDAGGQAASSDLRLGMVVEVTGSDITTDARTGRRRATASQVQVRSEIEGPIQAIDADAGTLIVLDQVVRINARTVFDDDLRGGLGQLALGELIEVYGLVNGAGELVASRIEREDHTRYYKLRGSVQALDTAAQTFMIGTTLVYWGSTTIAATELANGTYVRVELLLARRADGAWTASRIRTHGRGGSIALPEGAKAEIEGYITAFTSSVDFAVSGVPVDASRVRRLPPGLALGVRVEVEGILANGVLHADEVEIENDDDDDEFEIEGRITSVDRQTRTFVLHGVLVDYSRARFDDGTEADLAPGVRVEVEGHLAADGTTLVATEVDFEDDDDDDDEFEIEGRIDSVDRQARTFILRGRLVDYSGARFDDGTEADLAPGVKVEVEGYLAPDGTTVIATEIEFDD